VPLGDALAHLERGGTGRPGSPLSQGPPGVNKLVAIELAPQAARAKVLAATTRPLADRDTAVPLGRPFLWKEQRRGRDGVGETRFSRAAVLRPQSLGSSLCARIGRQTRRRSLAAMRRSTLRCACRGGCRSKVDWIESTAGRW
jgi:hypothetical protein